MQLWGNETLIVVGLGLQANTQYTMLFVGLALPDSMADPLPPVAPLSIVSVETSTPLVAALPIVSGGTYTVTVPTLTRRLTIVVKTSGAAGSSGMITVTGGTTGTVWAQYNLINGTRAQFVAIEPSLDATYLIQPSGFAGTDTLWVTAESSNPLVTTVESSPLAVVGTSLPGTIPVSTTGPMGVYKSFSGGGFAIGNNQLLIAAPGSGLSIYLQTLFADIGPGAPADALIRFHSAGGGTIVDLALKLATDSKQATFPGGLEISTNTALHVDVFGNAVFAGTTYVVGASL